MYIYIVLHYIFEYSERPSIRELHLHLKISMDISIDLWVRLIKKKVWSCTTQREKTEPRDVS